MNTTHLHPFHSVMKKLLLATTVLALCLAPKTRAQDETAEDGTKPGEVVYALILPEEKAPELVKPNEPSPFGGILDDKIKDTASGEESKVGDMLRSLPVVGKSSLNCVLLGDIILRKGEVVPPIIPNQTVQLYVRDISATEIELVWVEKKPTGLNPRTLTILTDVSPQVMQRLPGGGSKAGSGPPVMAIIAKAKSLLALESSKPAPRAELAEDTTPAADAPPGASGEPAKTGGSSLLNLFFGNQQVKEPASANKPLEQEETKPGHEAKP